MANEVTSFEVQGNNYDLKPNLTFDTTPTIGSTNPVTSNGIALAVQAAAIGTDISVGRTEDSQIGYCSIAYGEENIASGDYGIVFGQNNTATCEASIVTGYYNDCNGVGRNAIFGSNNGVSGVYNFVAGINNKSNCSIQNITDSQYPGNTTNNQVFIGYVNPSTRKIYYDPEMTVEIEVPALLNGYTYYFIDRTPSSGDRNVGDAYQYDRIGNTLHFTKIYYTAYIELTNICYSRKYIYSGNCYFNPRTDKNYSDESMTTEITPTEGCIYFDVNDGSFVLANTRGLLNYGDVPKWVRKKTYKGSSSGMYGGTSTATYWGRKAYISTEYSASDRWHVYTSSERDPLTDITNSLYDGEMITDISTGYNYLYEFDVDHNLVSVVDKTSYDESSAQMVVGGDNAVGSGRGAIIVGDRNVATGNVQGCGIIGKNNTVTSGDLAGGLFFIAGYENSLLQKSGYGSFIMGRSQSVECEGYSEGDMVAIGVNNTAYGLGTHHSHIYGSYNELGGADNVFVCGTTNRVFLSQYTTILGDYNEVAYNMFAGSDIDGGCKSVKKGYWLQDGTVNIGGTIYDILINPASSSRFPTDEIFFMYGKNGYGQEEMLHIAYSPNGTNLYTYNVSKEGYPAYILGCYNRLYNSVNRYTSNTTVLQSSYNYMVGGFNEMYAGGSNCIGLLGYHLKYYGGFGNTNKIDGSIRMGAYNDDSSACGYTTGAKVQLVVGIGTADNDRKNGFVVLQTGELLAPECTNSISEATSHIYSNPNKLIVTYGMLQDYAPRTPGAVGKPAVTIVTLSANDWSSDEQTVTVTDMSASCVVIAQPNASPYAYNYHEIYVKEQGTDTLTFKCATVPAVDIDVKVVYWT